MIAAPMVPLLQHAGCTDQCGTFLPEDDGPPVLVVGSLASPERMAALARRHGLEVDTLLASATTGIRRGT
ncbi:hypothetical protein [Pseudorhodoferax sp. Leaf267]|uniref:hypothetical protein n=1 Tax=Pseudorhodoferax sp. Leaf267 TaxID=1736316 RepID=UPI0006FE105D|nr:hypothetical protein [Pseudorhodoferax sp. Leaf267]KQP20569.1 hypothetical protein ASF43_27480 [Pseudorhodoferax sp. Leaf267]